MDDLRLRPLIESDEPAVLAAQEELRAEHFCFALDHDPGMPWNDYLTRLELLRSGVDLPGDRVPATLLAAVSGGELVGRVSIRHRLNDFLAHEGGHIGFAVIPRFRRRGFASAILRQSLVVSRSLGVERVLITCDDDNAGSAAVITGCGGVLHSVVTSTQRGPIRRYWID